MKKIKFVKIIKNLNHTGQGIMEYIIISSLVGVLCVVAMKQFGDVLEKRAKVIKSKIAENIKLR